MRRREVVRLFSGAAASVLLRPLAAHAQNAALPVIGVLGSASASAYRERLTFIGQGLADSGFTAGRNVAMDYRWAEGQLDRLPALAAELVDRRADVIIATGGLQAPRAALAATSTIPIVFSADGDPVKQGLVASLNRPGGNATGITVFSASLTAKRWSFSARSYLQPRCLPYSSIRPPHRRPIRSRMRERARRCSVSSCVY